MSPTDRAPGPAEPDPTHPDPAHPDPAGPSPAEPAPAHSGPAETRPPEPDPTRSEPTESGSAEPDPTRSRPTGTGPAEPGPAPHDPAEPGPAEPEPAGSGSPAEPDPAGSGPAEAGPSAPGRPDRGVDEPGSAERVPPGSAEPGDEPGSAERVPPGSAEPGSAHPDLPEPAPPARDARDGGAARPLRTGSLRRRVVLYSVAVLALVLVAVSVLAEVFVGIQSRADLVSRLNERATLADQLAAQHVAPDDLVDRVSGAAIRARLVMPDGRLYGVRRAPDPDRVDQARADPPAPGTTDSAPAAASPPTTSPAPTRHPAPNARRPHPAARRAGPNGPIVHRTLVDGSRLTLFGDADELTAIQRRLARLLLVLDVGGLALAGLALLGTTRAALRPLETMTALARSIAAGDRGRRLSPTSPATELGRTAAAFDDMLDALEGAERTSRSAEATARSAESAARAAEAEARASELRTRRFVADAAHELRTPVTGLRAAAEAVLSTAATGEERDRLLMLLVREAGRAGRLVEDLLALAQIDAGLRVLHTPVDLRELAETEVERLRLLAPDLTVRITGGPLTVPGDARLLSQVVSNLLGNARRHAPPDGLVEVEVGREETSGTAPTARLRVSDSGPGVPDRERDRIFDRLVRLDEARGRDAEGGSGPVGAGLGLAIARGIARAHGGELRCVAGSLFELTLPVGPGRPPATGQPSATG
jgi:two-component system, OmpR family, sensor kinase